MHSFDEVWNGVITIKHGLYGGGIFRFKLLIPDEFPDTSDTIAVVFTPAIYHPSVQPATGQLDCKQMFEPWKKNVHHIWHIMAYVKSIFSSIDCSNCLNEKAAENYTNSTEQFKFEVKKSIEQSNLHLLNDTDPDDSYAFRFAGSDDDGLKAIEKLMLTMEMFSDSTLRYKSDLRTLGLSWLSEKI
ncbi:hypothetical protein HELRODRAFT_170805 [Helobdella robusta]|uniref:UBC core domain-containing protein n=1 Tax=Helobdella robusta TaxID=6412 RepID=T1F3G3_HELRO|nr:hypothetical protein HELRODRAFT_170805 [Helobdella robusta]ESO06787.1 hypothetical protein HELRODRAFT_170805 [Helobdella robusta]